MLATAPEAKLTRQKKECTGLHNKKVWWKFLGINLIQMIKRSSQECPHVSTALSGVGSTVSRFFPSGSESTIRRSRIAVYHVRKAWDRIWSFLTTKNHSGMPFLIRPACIICASLSQWYNAFICYQVQGIESVPLRFHGSKEIGLFPHYKLSCEYQGWMLDRPRL